jgi:hypothetical protein
MQRNFCLRKLPLHISKLSSAQPYFIVFLISQQHIRVIFATIELPPFVKKKPKD